jgi:hypothetical protein
MQQLKKLLDWQGEMDAMKGGGDLNHMDHA